MSGIQNINGGQHCYLNALLQCFSLNDVLFAALEKHNVTHIYEDEQVCVLCASYEILSVLRLTKPSTIVEHDIRRYILALGLDPLEPADPREMLTNFQANYSQITASYEFSFQQRITCTRCQTTSDTNYDEIFIQIPRETNSIEQGLRDWSGAELIANYHCRGCNANHPCTKKRTMTREPSFLVFHKTGATPTTLSPILRLDKDHYELSSFIEYSGRLPRNTSSKETVAHYIGYRNILGEWIRNDDSLVHTTSLEGQYKINLAFYRAMRSAPAPIFLDTSLMPVWHKAVVIRGVYRGRGRKPRGRGRGRGRSKPKEDIEDNQEQILPDDSSSSSEEENTKDKAYQLRKRPSSTRVSNYETRLSSRLREAVGQNTKHIALDQSGLPTSLDGEEVGRSIPRTRQRPSTRTSRRKLSPKPRLTEQTETDLNEQQPLSTGETETELNEQQPRSTGEIETEANEQQDGQNEAPDENTGDKEVPANNENPETTYSDNAESEKSEKDETYCPSNHDSDDDSNDDSGADSGDETHDYNTYSGDETDNVDKNSQAGSTSSSDEDALTDNVTRSKSPEFDDSGAESAETVELSVSKTPPARHMTLRSATKTPVPQNPIEPRPETNTAEDPEEPEPMKPLKPSNDKGKGKRTKGTKRGKQQSKRQKKFVTFTLPKQRNIRKDMVDENCARLKIKYKQWSGDNQVKGVLHKSHLNVNSESNIPTSQNIPGMCILCPTKKYLASNWDRDRHYNGVHIRNLIVVENTTALQCKCSEVRSRGWKKDRCTRNAHYHCTVCHWPRDRKPQLANHMVAKHNISSTAVAHLFDKNKEP